MTRRGRLRSGPAVTYNGGTAAIALPPLSTPRSLTTQHPMGDPFDTYREALVVETATTRREMSSVVGRNGRNSTRERSGVNVGPMRLAWRVVVFNRLKSRQHGQESEH